MNLRVLKLTLVSAPAVFLCSPEAFAWNDFGHMTVAYVAYQNLSPHTKQRAIALLKLHPDYEKWCLQQTKNLSADEAQSEIFMIAATWPDLIRVDPNYKSDGYANGSKPKGSQSTQNLGYSDHLLHKYWHHFDKPWSIDSTKTHAVPKPNAETQITEFRHVLSSNASDELKSYDLTWLLHLVGDLHQPLHCITRVSKDEPDGDDCALKVVLNPPGPDSSLHWYWDCALGKGGVDKVPAFAKSLPEVDTALASDLNVFDWIDEGYKLSKEKVYVTPIGKGNGPFDLDENYEKSASELAKRRVELAGKRLANLLNKDLK